MQADFSALSRERIADGQRELARSTRRVVQRDAAPICEVIDRLGQRVYLEPSLFTYIAEPRARIGLPQLIFGHIPEAQRPEAIEIDTDENGRAHVPGLGYFSTHERSAGLVLARAARPGAFHIMREGRAVDFELKRLRHVPGTTIELALHQDPLLATRFFDRSRRSVGSEVLVDNLAERHAASIGRAFGLLAQACPWLHEQLLAVTRRIVLFEASGVNSFASLAAHGTAFFNVRDADAEPYFLDEIAHQCGHVAFFALTLRRGDFLAADPGLQVDSREGAAADAGGRSLYGSFHGLYTEYTMMQALGAVERAGLLRGALAHELYGRLSFITRKAKRDLSLLDRPEWFTPLGRRLYEHFWRSFSALSAARPDLFETDLSGQPYTFDYGQFARTNPRARSAHAEPLGGEPA